MSTCRNGRGTSFSLCISFFILPHAYIQTSIYCASIYCTPLFIWAYSFVPNTGFKYVSSNIDTNSVYHAPLYTVLFCIPQRGTVNERLPVIASCFLFCLAVESRDAPLNKQNCIELALGLMQNLSCYL